IWPSGPLALWPSGPLALWPSGLLALWPSGPLAFWPSGPLALWPSGPLALWPSGLLALWPSGPLAFWPSGPLAFWPSGTRADLLFLRVFPVSANLRTRGTIQFRSLAEHARKRRATLDMLPSLRCSADSARNVGARSGKILLRSAAAALTIFTAGLRFH